MTTCRCGKTIVELICLRCFQAHPGHEGDDPTCFACILDRELEGIFIDAHHALLRDVKAMTGEQP